MMKRMLFPLFMLFYLSTALFGNNGVSMQIRFFDKTIYYPDSSVEIKIQLINDGTQPFSMKVADHKEYNLMFQVMNMRNQSQSLSDRYKSFMQSSNPYFYRTVNLQPGEEFSFNVKLQDFIQISDPGEYYIEAQFHPNLRNEISQNLETIYSNRILLSLRPQRGNSQVEDEIIEAREELLRVEKKSPDEVIQYILEARQLDHWDRFFLYTDLESLLQYNPPWERRFKNASEEERLSLINSFKESLMQENIEDLTSFMDKPDTFEILYTEYSPERAMVKVRQYFQSIRRDFSLVKDYTYYLQNDEGIWKIYFYEVKNVRTE